MIDIVLHSDQYEGNLLGDRSVTGFHGTITTLQLFCILYTTSNGEKLTF